MTNHLIMNQEMTSQQKMEVEGREHHKSAKVKRHNSRNKKLEKLCIQQSQYLSAIINQQVAQKMHKQTKP